MKLFIEFLKTAAIIYLILSIITVTIYFSKKYIRKIIDRFLDGE